MLLLVEIIWKVGARRFVLWRYVHLINCEPIKKNTFKITFFSWFSFDKVSRVLLFALSPDFPFVASINVKIRPNLWPPILREIGQKHKADSSAVNQTKTTSY